MGVGRESRELRNRRTCLRIKTMKVIDRLAGQALCAFLSRLMPAKPSVMPAADTVRTIALIKFWGMGSIVLMTPAIALLRAKYPGARLTFVTQAANREVISLLDGIDGVLLLDLGHGPAAFLASLLKLVAAMRKKRFDLAIDFEFFTRFSALLTGVSGARTTAGFQTPEIDRGNFHHVTSPFNSYWHIIDNFCALASGDLEPASFERPLQRMQASHETTARLSAKLANAGLAPQEPYLVINPNAGELALERRWSIERFARLIDELTSFFPGRLVVIGGPTESTYVDSMLALVKRKESLINLAARLPLDELVALLNDAKLFISNDTGPLHLACAAGAPTVSIFGPETPVLFGPRGPRHRTIYKHLACSPCLNIHNGRSVNCRFASPVCVTEISVSEVFQAAREQLESVSPLVSVREG
jgi:ADP-heptose:LPS heptosyltransferase